MKKRFGHDRQDLRWLLRRAPEARGYVGALTAVRILAGLVGTGYALCLRTIVDCAAAGNRAGLYRGIGLFAGLVLGQFVLAFLGRYLDELTQSTVENKLKLHLLDSLLRRDYAGVTAVHSGEWMNRLTSDTQVVARAATQILPGAASMAARLLAAVSMLLVLMPGLTAALLLGGLLLMSMTVWMRKSMKALHRRIQESDGRLRVFLTEHLGSLMMLKAYHQEQTAEAAADALMQQHKAARMKKNRFSNFCSSGFQLVMNSTFVLGAAVCGIGILNGSVGYGTFTAVIQLEGQLQAPLASLTGFVPQYYAMLASVERLMEADDFCADDGQACALPDQRVSGFGLRDVSYTYPDETAGRRGAVAHLTLEVQQGEYVAFTGPSGCGKSTVLKLLLGLYGPDAGTCYVKTAAGEVPLTRAWSRLFAYVPQGNHLMSGTIREVVSFACPERAGEDEAIFEALEIACADDFIRALPQGLDTKLGERGCGLSEGQMQRLAVARALFSRRPVLLLDESTSALDSASEVRLLHNIRALTGKTVVMVTHRPAALEIADKIVRFTEDGIQAEASGRT